MINCCQNKGVYDFWYLKRELERKKKEVESLIGKKKAFKGKYKCIPALVWFDVLSCLISCSLAIFSSRYLWFPSVIFNLVIHRISLSSIIYISTKNENHPFDIPIIHYLHFDQNKKIIHLI